MPGNLFNRLKHTAHQAVPWLYEPLQNAIGRRRYGPAQRAVQSACGDSVAAGPFAGMRYLAKAVGSSILPKLLGTYEAELHPIINRIRSRPYSAIIDVGCAEGFYAVGFARFFPGVPVFACDIDPTARRMCEQLALLNGLSRQVAVKTSCTSADLMQLSGQRTLIFSDCEGFEADLFSAPAIEALSCSDILIETHDFQIPGITSLLVERFGETHRVESVRMMAQRDQLPAAMRIAKRHRSRATEEGRPASQVWLWMEPLTLSGPLGVSEPQTMSGMDGVTMPNRRSQCGSLV